MSDTQGNGRASRRRYWIPGTVFALGLVSIGMLVGTNWIREQLVIQNVALVYAVGEIRTREAMSHLWLEEYVTGDEIHLDEAMENQGRSAALIEAILEGGVIAEGRYTLDRLSDPRLRSRAEGIRDLIEEFRRIADERRIGYERGETVGVGSNIDVEYDRIFDRMLGELAALQLAVDEHLESARRQSLLLFRTISIAWIAIVVIAVTGLWTRERRRRIVERALRERESQLVQSRKCRWTSDSPV